MLLRPSSESSRIQTEKGSNEGSDFGYIEMMYQFKWLIPCRIRGESWMNLFEYVMTALLLLLLVVSNSLGFGRCRGNCVLSVVSVVFFFFIYFSSFVSSLPNFSLFHSFQLADNDSSLGFFFFFFFRKILFLSFYSFFLLLLLLFSSFSDSLPTLSKGQEMDRKGHC